MRLGDLLVSSGIITGEQLEQALALPREDGQRLGDVLIRQGVISEAQLIDALRVQLGVDFVDLTAVSIPVELAKYVPRNLAKKFLVVPVKLVQDRLYLAMHDPLDFVAQDEVKTASRKRIIPMIATRKAVEQAIERLYGSEGTARVIEEMKREAGAGEDIIPAQMARDTADPEASAPTIRFVNSLIERAFTERASDIHLEPQEGEMLVRMRIDGLLQRVLTVPADLQNTVISRLKIMGGMNIAEHKVPQDGHAMFSVRGHSLDLRIASMPTVYGEKIVLRLLDKSAQVLDKSVLGLEGRDLDNYNALLKNTSGVVLLVGPTGSGKSTTMSNMLRDLSSDALNIVTLEDPVEYHLPGVNQCQINEKTGMTFASGLRAILRQDPDIIAVGEIRDGETASIAMRAAITGHLVFSTLHTNDAVSAVHRLEDIGVEPWLVSSALRGVVSQRLVRKLCPHCKTAYRPSAEELLLLGLPEDSDVTFYKGAGCPECRHSGYIGRRAVFEILLLNSRLRRRISHGADGTAANYDFHPIAGAVNNGQLNRGNETYDLTLYNWFGGIYDGGNYYIKNVNITSHCYNVGLFGTTAGAEIKNIVLYSDNDAVIQRKTDATPASGATGPENYATSYALGGLVGIAYDYDENLKDKTKVSTISNCAIAGYTVTDNSKNRQFLGEAAIGGLVGVSSANLNRCSAVVKLNINCTHRYASEGAMNKAQWGNYVRVGGLVGGVRYDVSDCYTGGSITVANDLLNERIPTDDSTNTFFVDRYESTPKSVKMTQGGAETGPDTYVYIGGIGGSGFSATFANFSGSKDGQPTYNNCYTYMTFPAMEGTITGISLIGSIADRAGVNGGTAQLTINNCYYLDSSAAISFNSLPTFYSKSTKSNGQYTYYSLSTLLNTDAVRMDMLRGKLSYLSKYTWNTGSSPYTINGLRALSYEQMSGRADIAGKSFTALLNGGSDDGSFHWVTTEENGQSAHGKYSFPGSAAALRGQDYPFPTVLTQGTACLHYGEWPSRGLYWSSGVLSLDRITTPSVTLSLHFTQDIGTDATPTITCSRNGIVAVSEPKAQTPPADVRHSYAVTLTGLSVGSTEVFATLGDYTARLLVSVTSTLDISVDGLPGDDFFVGDTCNLTLTARDSRGSALDVKWTVTPQHGNSVLTASVPVTKADRTASVTLTAAGEGEDRTLVTATYTAPGGETFTSQLPLVLPVRMQGVLGIANTSGEPSVYWQGVMDRDGTAFTDDVPSGAPYTDRPAYAGAKLYLYSRGSAATFDGLSVSGVTVKGGADATEYVLRPMPVSNDEDTSVLHPDVFRAENDDFRVTVGTPAKDTTSAFTYRPLTVKGRSQGQITLTVTLTDAENHAFTLSIPYTLTEEDTRVTATLRVDEQALTLSVPYGTAPAAEALSQLLTDNGISPDTIDSWTPDITQPLYADTAFTAVRKTTDSGGAPTVPDADTPASDSKDPEDTPSDDPSAPDSSSSGTDPTPEPSPDTLP